MPTSPIPTPITIRHSTRLPAERTPPATDGDEIRAENARLRRFLIAALLVLIIGGTIDIVLDRPSNWSSAHAILEVALIGAAIIFATVLWLRWSRAEASVRRLERSLAEQEAERERWRAESADARERFSRAIQAQFQKWELTPTEREIAFLLLQGDGHKQIAARTGRSERTVRQHAVAVYQKSGLAGRAELAAFFLEGLLPGDG